MSDDAIDILEGELDALVPEALWVLGDDELLLLADLLHDAKAREAQELDKILFG